MEYEVQRDELQIWLENFCSGIRNETIVFLNKNIIINNSNINLIDSKNLKYSEKYSNVVVKTYFTEKSIDFNKFINLIFKKPLIIIKDETSINNFLELLKNCKKDGELDVKYYTLDKKDFEELLNMDKKELIELLEKEHLYLSLFYPNLPHDEEEISFCIDVLKQHNILKANFANYLYKYAYLDFNANTTKVGIQIRKFFGVKSKTISHIISYDLLFNKRKPFKGYDLNADKYLEIKKKIAKKLIKLNCKTLDVYKIVEITELPEKIVQKLINNHKS